MIQGFVFKLNGMVTSIDNIPDNLSEEEIKNMALKKIYELKDQIKIVNVIHEKDKFINIICDYTR